MKLLTILLSVYMTCVALMPCQDDDDKVTYSFATTISKSKPCNDQAGQESCPPFCTCNCCSTARYVAVQLITAPITLELVTNYPAYKMLGVQQQSLDIWQPPQLA